MTQTQMGLIIGGLVPTFLFGLAGICQKLSAQQGLSTGLYLTCVGLGATVVGVTIMCFQKLPILSIQTTWAALAMGVAWGLGVVLIAIAISHYNAPLSKLAPLYNMNTLVTVIGALIIFSEWRDVNTVKLILGSLLIIGGGILVSS